jgi:hypothetical protein
MKRVTILFVAVALLSGCTIWLRQSYDGIRASVLKATPLGSTPEFVQEVAKKKGWKTDRFHGFSPDRGYWMHGPATPVERVVGVSSFSAVLGEFHEVPVPFVTTVEAYWGFDKDGRLIDVWIRSSTDAL